MEAVEAPEKSDLLHPVDQAVMDFAAALKTQRLKNDDLAGLLAQQETLSEQIAAGQKDLAAAAADTQAKRQALDAACDASGLLILPSLTVSARAVSAAAETVGADNSQPEEKAVAVDHASDAEDTADNE